jgi:hypothetical protein
MSWHAPLRAFRAKQPWTDLQAPAAKDTLSFHTATELVERHCVGKRFDPRFANAQVVSGRELYALSASRQRKCSNQQLEIRSPAIGACKRLVRSGLEDLANERDAKQSE